MCKVQGLEHIYTDTNGCRTSSLHGKEQHYIFTVDTEETKNDDCLSVLSEVYFQNGAVPENDINGVTNENVLAMLIHRTKILDGKFPCDENKQAIEHMEAALKTFEARTKDRQARGVEGKLEV